jgi:two-component system, NarL family, response regulator NreC
MRTDLRGDQTETASTVTPRSASPIGVVLADSHAAMRRSLRLVLDEEDDIRVLAEAADVETLRSQLHRHRPDVLVLDVGMRNGSGIEVSRHLHQRGDGPEIVVLTMQDSPSYARHALDAGATGFVLKDRADTDLPQAVRAAAGGRIYVSPFVDAGLDALSPR